MSFKADTKQLKKFEKDLLRLNKKGIPHAVRETLTKTAWDARSEWQEGLRKDFTLRNKFTERSIVVQSARGTDMRRMESRVGSLAPYMGTQEEGGTLRGSGQGFPVPALAARTSGSKSRLVARPNKVGNIRLGPRRGKSQKQRNAIQIAQAKQSNSKFALIESGRKRGIFRVKGGKRKTQLQIVQDLTPRSVTIKPTKTMKPAVIRASSNITRHYVDALKTQLVRASTWKR